LNRNTLSKSQPYPGPSNEESHPVIDPYEMETRVSGLKAMFPTHDKEQIRRTLSLCRGDFEAAVNVLMGGTYPSAKSMFPLFDGHWSARISFNSCCIIIPEIAYFLVFAQLKGYNLF